MLPSLSHSATVKRILVVIMRSELVSKEMVTVFVRYTTGDKVSFQIDLTSSVKDLKEQVEKKDARLQEVGYKNY